MSHNCAHHHHDVPQDRHGRRRLATVFVLVLVYFFAELVGGWWTGSLALLADAGHMFSDLTAVSLSLLASWIAGKAPGRQQTFGWHRAEVLAALVNGALLLFVAGTVVHEAWHRLHDPREILGGPMLLIAIGGLIVNLVSLAVLHSGRDQTLNLRGAWLHVMGDTLGSVGVLTAAMLIALFGWTWADPVASIVVCLLIVASSIALLQSTMGILMEHAPSEIDVEHVRSLLLEQDYVTDVHCLHVWTIATGLRALSAHVVVPDDEDQQQRLLELSQRLADTFPIEHLTLQLESQSGPGCPQNAEETCLTSISGAPLSESIP